MTEETALAIAGRIYPAKSAKLELIDLLKEVMDAPYQQGDRVSVPRVIYQRAIDDLEHGVQVLDALQDERDKNFATEHEARQPQPPRRQFFWRWPGEGMSWFMWAAQNYGSRWIIWRVGPINYWVEAARPGENAGTVRRRKIVNT